MNSSCPSCGNAVDASHNFCPTCGQPLGAKAAPASPSTEEAELRPLTVMFCDLVGSTSLAERVEPEEYRALFQQYYAICDDAIRTHGGHVVKHIGDGVMAYFGYPVATDEDAAGAALAGLQICARAAEAFHGEEHTVDLDVRVGINTGAAIVGLAGAGTTREALSVGDTVNVAARVEGAAPPGRVAVTATTRRLIDDRFDLTSLGPTALKGVSEPIELFVVNAERMRLQRRLERSVLVGRDGELARIAELAGEVVEGGARFLAVSGEPGVGKSRLVDAARRQLGLRTVTVACLRAERHSNLRPISALLAELGNSLAADGVIAPTSDAVGDDTAAGLTPQARRVRQFEAARSAFRRAAEHDPLLLVIEDLHWSDPSTLEFLGWMAASELGARLFVLMTTRPDLELPGTFDRIELGPLEAAQARELVAALGQLEPHVAAAVVERADGIPLFLEELVQSAAEGWRSEDGVPITLHALFTAQLDRVGRARRIAQVGALLGTRFAVDDLRDLVDTPSRIETDVQSLIDADLFVRVDDTTVGFRHALMQEAASASMVASVRRREHRTIALTLERRAAEGRSIAPQAIGYHWASAGYDDHALPYHLQAASEAADEFANVEALGLYEQALRGLDRLVGRDPARYSPQLLEVQERRGDILALLHDLDDAESAYRLALASTPDPVRRSQLFTKLALVHQQNEELARAAFSQAERALEPADADRADVREARLRLQLARLRMHYWFGDAAAMRTIIDQVESLVEEHASPHQKVEFFDQCVLANFRSERYAMSDDTRELSLRYLEAAHESADKSLLAEARFTNAFILLFGGQAEAAIPELELALDLARDVGSRAIEVRATVYHATAQRLVGVADEAFIERCRQSLDLARAEGMAEYEAVVLSNLAWLAWHAGQTERAAELADEAVELWESTSMAWPFRWLALFPRLAAAVAVGDAAGVRSVLDALAHPTQQQLPDPVGSMLVEAAARAGEPDRDVIGDAALLLDAAGEVGLFGDPVTGLAPALDVLPRRPRDPMRYSPEPTRSGEISHGEVRA